MRQKSRGKLIVALCCLLAQPARAEPEEAAAADVLFKSGREARERGECAEAVGKLQESHRLDPSPGTLLNLADCYEQLGKLASAWTTFVEAKGLAEARGRTATAVEADRRAMALEGRLSYLVVKVAAPEPGLVVLRGKIELKSASFGTALPVDAGVQHVTATAPGYEPWQAEIQVDEGLQVVLVVPRLVPKKPVGPVSDGPPTKGPWPWVLGAAGLTTGIVAGGFGIAAKVEHDAALALCPSRTSCSDEAMAKESQAGTFADVSTVLFPLAGALVAGGVALWFLAPSEASPPRAQVGIGLNHGAFVTYRGEF